MADIIEEVEDEVIEIPAREVAISQDRIETTLEKELTPVKEKIEVAEKPEEEALNDTPEKYRGKSAKEVIEMHQAAEKLIGKQGSEVGELRRVVDDFIQTQTSKESQTTETEVAPEDFYDNPAKNVKREIDNHPAIKEAKQAALEMKRSSTLTRLNAEYPELESTVQDPAFAEWI